MPGSSDGEHCVRALRILVISALPLLYGPLLLGSDIWPMPNSTATGESGERSAARQYHRFEQGLNDYWASWEVFSSLYCS